MYPDTEIERQALIAAIDRNNVEKTKEKMRQTYIILIYVCGMVDWRRATSIN